MQDSIEALIHETLVREVSSTIVLHGYEKQMIRSGMSGATLSRFEVTTSTADNIEKKTMTVVIKECDLIERRVLNMLHQQGMNVPYNFSFHFTSDAPDFICLQDLGINHIQDPFSISDACLKKEAFELARIHATNLQREAQLAWLPTIDLRFIEHWLQVGWRESWLEAIQSEEFVDVFRPYISQVEQSARYIVEDMGRVIQDSSLNSLVHTDLHGGNVLIHNNQVYFIDWAEAHYGSIMLDLPHNLCTTRHVQHYVEALNELHVRVPEKLFYEQYAICRRYIGFRYMGWLLHIWQEDKGATEWIIHQMNMTLD